LYGHDVHEAPSGRAGLSLADECQPDVVFLDIGLPDLDGYEVGETLRASFGTRVRLVALTGYGQPTDRERAIKAGFEAHLVKPVDARTILETLSSLALYAVADRP
jgi:CheY-like chemotaxis protein